ncbi:MAG TPA: M67 family metallopeptidase [Vicinamibacterales bacterium]
MAAAWASPWSSRCPLPDGVGITQAALDIIAAHARSEHPRECCGLLVGTTQAILKAVPVENVAADPFRRFEIAPAAYVAEIRRCREQGGEVVGAYHSHPLSAPEPSPTDQEMAFSDFIFVIAGPVTERRDVDVRAYVLRDGALAELTLAAI